MAGKTPIDRFNTGLYSLAAEQRDEASRATARQAARKNLAALICLRHGINPGANEAIAQSHLIAAADEFALLAEILDL